MAFWKESMINWLSNLINRNRSAAKISQALCSSDDAHGDQGPPTICANWPPLSDSAGRAPLSAESHHMWCTSHQWGYHPLSKVSHHV